MSKIKTGIVRFYNKHLKQGLIKCDDGYMDIPIYDYHLEKFGMEKLKTGDSVKFEIERVGNTHTILAIKYLDEEIES